MTSLTCPFCGATDHPTETGIVPEFGEVTGVRCPSWEAATDAERHEMAVLLRRARTDLEGWIDNKDEPADTRALIALLDAARKA